MFEHNTKKEIKGMIEALLMLADHDFSNMKVLLTPDGKAERMDGFAIEMEADDGNYADLSDKQIFTVGDKHIGPAWLLLLHLNKTYFWKKKSGLKSYGYEPLTMAIAVEFLHKRDGMSYGKTEQIVAEEAGETLGNVKTYHCCPAN